MRRLIRFHSALRAEVRSILSGYLSASVDNGLGLNIA